ncbi:MAG: hypothetical protein PW788_10765 [Micavibrio sp.]|nr:hypothetical protein [Micavibrio sp.]
MTNPSTALKLFQNDVLENKIPLQRGQVDSNLFVCCDEPNGRLRFNYMRIERQIITAFVMFVSVNPIDGIPCFNIGYAVPEKCQKQGRAKEVVNTAISEMQTGFGLAGVVSLYIEAIVETSNIASQKVAAHTLSLEPKSIIDQFSNLPALQYIRKVNFNPKHNSCD